MNFPYPEVYDYFARPIVETGLAADPTSELYVVRTAERRVIETTPLPVSHYFEDEASKARLGRAIHLMLHFLPPDAALVLIHEVWTKTTMRSQLRDRTQNLAHDPEADEAVGIFLYHGDELRMGMLPIANGRTVSYRPLNPPSLSVGGRLTPYPDVDPEQAAAAAAATKDALDKARNNN